MKILIHHMRLVVCFDHCMMDIAYLISESCCFVSFLFIGTLRYSRLIELRIAFQFMHFSILFFSRRHKAT